MSMHEKTAILKAILKWRFLRRGTPLVVLWTITTRCNSRCSYCSCWNHSNTDLSLDRIKEIADSLKSQGTLRISLTGGEPVLRGDIDRIIAYLKKQDFYVSMNSNGILLHERIEKIRKADLVQLSLDGKRENHDRIRKTESYDHVIRSAEALASNNISFSFNATIADQGKDDLDHLLDIASSYKTHINFQPACNMPYSSKVANSPVSREHIKNIFTYLAELKKQNPGLIMNSIPAIDYMKSWPKGENERCLAGKLYYLIGINGKVYRCAMHENSLAEKSCIPEEISGFSRSFSKRDSCLLFCCSSALEMNYIFSFNISAIRNALKLDI